MRGLVLFPGHSRSMVSVDENKKILLLTPVPVEGNRSNIIFTEKMLFNNQHEL